MKFLKICTECGGVYRQKENTCPNCSCSKSVPMIDVHPLLAEAVGMLYVKGYLVEDSGANALYDKSKQAYLFFNEDTVPKTCPKGWKRVGYSIQTEKGMGVTLANLWSLLDWSKSIEKWSDDNKEVF